MATALVAPPELRSDRRSFAQGAIVGVTNPKTVVFLAAILPCPGARTDMPAANAVGPALTGPIDRLRALGDPDLTAARLGERPTVVAQTCTTVS
jgi:hypothetical protein